MQISFILIVKVQATHIFQKLLCYFVLGEFAERRCSENGKWEGRHGERDSPNGWTNYTPCFTPEMLLLIQKLYTGNEGAAKVMLNYF